MEDTDRISHEHSVGDTAASYAAEVQADRTGTWAGNALRFACCWEAEQYVADLKARWTLVTGTRVVESADPVNYRWVEALGKAVHIA